MNKRRTILILLLIAILALSAGFAYAGNGKGGDGNGDGSTCEVGDCDNGGNGNGNGDGSGNGGGQNGNGNGNGDGSGDGGGQNGNGNGNGDSSGDGSDENGNGNGNGNGQRIRARSGDLLEDLPPVSEEPLTEDVIAAMKAGILDEYNAHATYAAVIEQFGEVPPFTNIMASEAQHIAAWEFLFDRYALLLPAPTQPDVPEFETLADACAAAAAAEIANFGLYDNMMATFEDYPDLLHVATVLRDASELHHLPAFESCAQNTLSIDAMD